MVFFSDPISPAFGDSESWIATGCRASILATFSRLAAACFFALRVDDFRAALAFGLSLARDRADHLVGKIHLFHLDQSYLYAPRPSVLIERGLQLHVELLALAQQLVQFHLAQYAAQTGLR